MTRNIYVFDLDGTLADCSHRLHHIQKEPKDWTAFFAACGGDAEIHAVSAILKWLTRGYGGPDVWIVSARSEEVRPQTEAWLEDHYLPHDNLIMRPADDRTQDHDLKERWLLDGTLPRERIIAVFEDRKRVVDMWRRHGIPCFQVAAGEF